MSSVTQPAKADWNQSSVYRGGGWFNNDPAGVRASRRHGLAVTYRLDNLGFRCARQALHGSRP